MLTPSSMVTVFVGFSLKKKISSIEEARCAQQPLTSHSLDSTPVRNMPGSVLAFRANAPWLFVVFA